jgi:hypothetical protein
LNWDAIGAVGEVVGAAAVVATLVYLSIQIRQNTRSNQVSAEIEALQQLSSWVTRISTDKDAQRLWDLVAEGSEPLSTEDSGQYLWIMGELFWVVESAFVQYRRGYLSKEAWTRFESTLVGTLSNKLTRDWWQNREVPHSPEFRSHVDQLIQTGKTDWRPQKTGREP